MILTDSHTHFYDFFDDSLNICICSTTLENFIQIKKTNNKKVIKSIGIHPWFVNNIPKNYKEILETELLEDKNLMIGETGLDFFKEEKLLQEEVFLFHLEMGKKYNRTTTVHAVKSWHRIIPILKKFKDLNIVLHSFNASFNILEELRNFENLYFSLSPKSKKEIFKFIPQNRLLIESDFDKNNPENDYKTTLINIYQKVADELNLNVRDLSKILLENYNKAFKLG